MINEQVKQILRECSTEQMTPVGTGIIHQRLVDYDSLAKQIVGETILAVLSTDTRDCEYTTVDKDTVNYVINKVIDNIRKHWSFQ